MRGVGSLRARSRYSQGGLAFLVPAFDGAHDPSAGTWQQVQMATKSIVVIGNSAFAGRGAKSLTRPAATGQRSRDDAAARYARAVPELPDIVVYLGALEPRIVGQPLQRLRLLNPFLLRTAVPPIASLDGRRVDSLRRVGKRIVLAFEGELFLVIHLMIAGRLRWVAPGGKPPGKIALALFEFPSGILVLTEAGSKRRASLHLVEGEAALAAMDPGGLDVMRADLPAFEQRLRLRNHIVKRALTDPQVFSGIGNAYSDEILHRARLSPFKHTQTMAAEEVATLYTATQNVLSEWTKLLRDELGDKFPDKVTAFHAGMAVHGRYGHPCPDCGAPVQRIVLADNEMNYCARCQTGGKLLADRALSRLLHDSFPRHIDELM